MQPANMDLSARSHRLAGGVPSPRCESLETSKIAPIPAAAPESWLIWLEPMPLMFRRPLRELLCLSVP